MGPEEGGRVRLDNMREVGKAEYAILLRQQVDRPVDTPLDVKIAESRDQLPITLSHAKTEKLLGGLRLIMSHHLSEGPIKPKEARSWLDKISGEEDQ